MHKNDAVYFYGAYYLSWGGRAVTTYWFPVLSLEIKIHVNVTTLNFCYWRVSSRWGRTAWTTSMRLR